MKVNTNNLFKKGRNSLYKHKKWKLSSRINSKEGRGNFVMIAREKVISRTYLSRFEGYMQIKGPQFEWPTDLGASPLALDAVARAGEAEFVVRLRRALHEVGVLEPLVADGALEGGAAAGGGRGGRVGSRGHGRHHLGVRIRVGVGRRGRRRAHVARPWRTTSTRRTSCETHIRTWAQNLTCWLRTICHSQDLIEFNWFLFMQ